MSDRKIVDVINRVISTIEKYTNDDSNHLISSLQELNSLITYTAPEAMALRWDKLCTLMTNAYNDCVQKYGVKPAWHEETLKIISNEASENSKKSYFVIKSTSCFDGLNSSIVAEHDSEKDAYTHAITLLCEANRELEWHTWTADDLQNTSIKDLKQHAHKLKYLAETNCDYKKKIFTCYHVQVGKSLK